MLQKFPRFLTWLNLIVLIEVMPWIAWAKGKTEKLPIPVQIGTDENGNPIYWSYQDVDWIKTQSLGWLASVVLLLGKIIWDMWQKKGDKSDTKLDEILKAVEKVQNDISELEGDVRVISRALDNKVDEKGLVDTIQKQIVHYDNLKHKRS